MRILFFVLGDRSRASTRLRVLNIIPYFEENGVNCDVVSLKPFKNSLRLVMSLGYLFAIIKLTIVAPRSDVVYIQKAPLPGIYIKFLEAFSTVIYDFDDAIYADRPNKNGPNIWKPLLDSTLSAASGIVAGSPQLATYAEQFNDNVRSIPTGIPEQQYKTRRVTTNPEGSQVVIGWIGNPENLAYIQEHKIPIKRVLDSYSQAQLLVITAGEIPSKPLSDRSDVEYRHWTLDTALDSLAEADIGIRPLSQDEWAESKGGYTSVVQMMALSLPVIVTPVGMLTEVVEHTVSGFHASSDSEWEEYISRLIENNHRRLEMGEQAVKRIEEYGFWTETKADEVYRFIQETTAKK